MTYLQKKKLAFMSIVNQIKGFVRTVTGIPPLTLPDCVDADSIINYTIDGNSVQDGTPTPENPVEVERVGEKTKNLIGVKPVSRTINGATFTVNENGSITLNGTTTSQAVYHFNPSYNEPIRRVSVTANKSYTLSRGVELPTGVYFMTYYIDSSGAYTYINSPKTFTPTEDVDIALYIRWDAGITMDNVTIYPQLEEGSTATEYEPYGYKILIKASGKNLLGDYVYTDQTTRYYPVISTKNPYTLKQGVTYIISFDTPSTDKVVYFHHYAKTKEKFVALSLDGTRKSFAVTPTEDITNVKNVVSVFTEMSEGESAGLCSNCMIEINPTETDYEPYVEPITTNIYLDESLDYADYIDFENQKVVRGIRRRKVNTNTGMVNYTYGTELDNTYHFYIYSLDGKPYCAKDTAMFCNIFKSGAISMNKNETESFFTSKYADANNYGMIYLQIEKELIDNYIGDTLVDKVRAFLIEKETELIYRTTEPTETDIDLPKLPTFKGTTIYSIETAVQPTNMSATYYSTSKGD